MPSLVEGIYLIMAICSPSAVAVPKCEEREAIKKGLIIP